jgi:hypothetical protein
MQHIGHNVAPVGFVPKPGQLPIEGEQLPSDVMGEVAGSLPGYRARKLAPANEGPETDRRVASYLAGWPRSPLIPFGCHQVPPWCQRGTVGLCLGWRDVRRV